MQFLLSQLHPSPTPEPTGEVDEDATTSTTELYRDTTTDYLYTDQTLETAFTAIVEGEENPVQVKVVDTDTITIGGNTFVKLTAGELDVVDTNGYQLVLDSAEGNICYIVDGVAETSSMAITDVTPGP